MGLFSFIKNAGAKVFGIGKTTEEEAAEARAKVIAANAKADAEELRVEKMAALNISEEELWWYLDLRKYGTAVHSGFGLGFERLVMFATGMGNIRDVIPYPRTPQNADF